MSYDGLENRVVKLETEMTQFRADVNRLGIEAKERRNECRDAMKQLSIDIGRIRSNDLAHVEQELDKKRGFSRKEWAAIIIAIITSLASIVVALVK